MRKNLIKARAEINRLPKTISYEDLPIALVRIENDYGVKTRMIYDHTSRTDRMIIEVIGYEDKFVIKQIAYFKFKHLVKLCGDDRIITTHGGLTIIKYDNDNIEYLSNGVVIAFYQAVIERLYTIADISTYAAARHIAYINSVHANAHNYAFFKG